MAGIQGFDNEDKEPFVKHNHHRNTDLLDNIKAYLGRVDQGPPKRSRETALDSKQEFPCIADGVATATLRNLGRRHQLSQTRVEQVANQIGGTDV